MATNIQQLDMEEVVNKQEYIIDIVAKFNQDENHPGLTGFERSVLFKIRDSERIIIDLTTKMDEKNKEVSELHGKIVREQGRLDGIKETLFCMLDQ